MTGQEKRDQHAAEVDAFLAAVDQVSGDTAPEDHKVRSRLMATRRARIVEPVRVPTVTTPAGYAARHRVDRPAWGVVVQ